MVTTTGTGTDPDQGHLQKQDCASDLDWSRPEAANSTGTGTEEQQLREWARAKDLCGSSHGLQPKEVGYIYKNTGN